MQVLADTIDLPCRIAKGCKYCTRDDAASCLVWFGNDRYALLVFIVSIIILVKQFSTVFLGCKSYVMQLLLGQ
jgi:hypothetical protein